MLLLSFSSSFFICFAGMFKSYLSQTLVCAAFLLFTISCKPGKKVPDVSNIKVTVEVQRFEQELFTADTNQLDVTMTQLSQKYPSFFGDFMGNIMGLPPTDSALIAIRGFIDSYRPVYQETKKLFADFTPYQKEIEKAYQFTNYYFPTYKLPAKVITFIGPMDALFTGSISSYGDAMTHAGPSVGLQLHLGKTYPAYQTGMETGIAFGYQVGRFTPSTIPVNVMKNVVDDMFPYGADGRPLIEQMIEKGKRLYILDQLMPFTADTLKIGYTQAQLDLCNKHEAEIWNFFVKNDLVYSIEPSINKEYIADGPKTQILGEGVPGYLGLYVGWQIVKKYMEKNDKITLDQLMQKNAKALFNEAGYKPE